MGAAKKTVMVLGACGFSGRAFEHFAAQSGLTEAFAFLGLDRDVSGAARTGAFSYREMDAVDPAQVAAALDEARPAYILNLVGLLHAATLEEFVAVNVGVTQAVCQGLLSTGLSIEKFVVVGSAAEYGAEQPNPVREDAPLHPVNLYGLSKVYQTLLARYYFDNHGLPIVVARTFNILGQGMSPRLSIGSFMQQIGTLPDGGAIKTGNIATSRDFLDISEVSSRYWNLLRKGAPGEVYNVCSGSPRTIRYVLEELIAASGKTLRIETDPALYKARDVASIYGDSSKYDQL